MYSRPGWRAAVKQSGGEMIQLGGFTLGRTDWTVEYRVQERVTQCNTLQNAGPCRVWGGPRDQAEDGAGAGGGGGSGGKHVSWSEVVKVRTVERWIDPASKQQR